MSTIRSLAMAAVLTSAAASMADQTVWLNVQNFPDDVCNATEGWSAIRIDDPDPDHASTRCAADDFVLDRPTRISEITFWGVEVGDPPIFGGDIYIYSWDNGKPGELLYAAPNLPMEHESICDNPNYGPVYRNTVHPEGLVLDAGGYFLAFRTNQGFNPNGGKNNNAAFSTRTSFGASAAFWSFFIQADGTGAGWQPLSDFNLSDLNEWCFEIKADVGDECYPDWNGDGVLDLFDFLGYVNSFNTYDPAADCVPDGYLDLFDFLCFVNEFNAGC